MAERAGVMWKTLAALVAVGVIAATIVGFAVVRVCDQQLTGDGRVVPVCRHLQVTDPPVLAGGFVLLVALGTFFGEISGFGFSLKQDVRAALRTAEVAKDQAAEARYATRAFEETASDLAEGVQQALTKGPLPPELPDDGDPRHELDRLAEEYNHLRWTTKSGPERTVVMTELVQRMIERAREVPKFDVLGYIRTNNAGRRLAAYAYLCAHPDPAWAPAVAESMLKDDKPFNQFWALRALDALQVPLSTVLDHDLVRRLRARLPELQGDASRFRLLSQLVGATAGDG